MHILLNLLMFTIVKRIYSFTDVNYLARKITNIICYIISKLTKLITFCGIILDKYFCEGDL